MVLAIGILVDDAIVVVENVERIMKEEGLPPREATIKAVQQIIGAIIGITLVLTAVFVPMAFFPGTPGGIYRQFSVTLVLSMAFSALLALTLTPALCATILKPHSHEPHPGFIGRFFERFNNWFDRATRSYDGRVRQILRKPLRWMAIYAALVAAVALMFSNLPSSFLPDEDQGVLFTVVQLPAGATQERTIEVVAKAEKVFEAQPQVDNVFAAVGFSFFGSGQNMAMMFVALKPWDERPGIENHSTTVVANSMQQLAGIREGMIFALNPPAISELGNASGFNFRLRDSGGQGQEKLIMARNMLLGMAAQSPKLMGVRPEGQSEGPQLQVMIDRVKARTLGLQIADINNTLSISFGSAYANDFTRDGRVLRVILQADAPARMTPEDLLDLRVRNERGEMVPFSAFTTVKWTAGPQQLQRYNGVPSLTISGNAAPGVSTGEALAEMERLFQQLPPGFDYEWSGLSLEEKQSAGQVPALLALSMLIVFLVLAALYESWTIPLAVMLVVPLGLIGALLAAFGAGLSNDIYFNVGMITIIGLSAKNAILIVEFARDLEKEGKDVVEATIMAARLRLRPILMTSLAFILGVLPLVLSAGAGAASRNAVGTGVMGGMVSATFLAIFFVPVFFVLVRKLFPGKPPVPSEPTSPMTATPETKHEG